MKAFFKKKSWSLQKNIFEVLIRPVNKDLIINPNLNCLHMSYLVTVTAWKLYEKFTPIYINKYLNYKILTLKVFYD